MARHAALLAFNFLGTTLILIPLTFHIRNRNFAVICLCVLLSISNAIYFINGNVWHSIPDGDTPLGKGYCDIVTRFQLIVGPALLGCAIAILRHLANILSRTSAAAMTGANKQRQNMIELAIIFTIPCLMIIFQTALFRETRYIITQFLGCQYSLVRYTPLLLLVVIWEPIMATISTLYAIMILYALNKKRKAFHEIIRNSQSGLDVSRFTRLFMMALLAIFFIAPIIFYSFYAQVIDIDLHYKYKPHGHFSQIIVYYLATPDGDSWLWAQWLTAIVSILFAALFGIGKEPFKTYRQCAYNIPGLRSIVHETKKLTGRFSIHLNCGRSRSCESTTGKLIRVGDGSIAPSQASSESCRTLKAQDSFLDDDKLVKNWNDEIFLSKGHNETTTSHTLTAARIWIPKTQEPRMEVSEPDKIRIRRDLTQESTLLTTPNNLAQ